MALAILAVIITITSFPSPWIQAARVLRTRSIDGLSSGYLLLGLMASTIWTTYGLASGILLQVALNTSSALAGLAVAMAAVASRQIPAHKVIITMVGVGVLSAVLFRLGPSAVGAVAMTMAVSARLPQIRKAWREPGGVAVSITSFVVAGICSASWVAYSLIIGDHVVLATATFNTFFAMFVVLRTRHGRSSALLSTNETVLGATPAAT